MKKLITIILTLSLLLPAAALAEDQDPIEGLWYFVIDINSYSADMQKKFEKNIHIRDTQREAHLFWFTENGEIYQSVTMFRTRQSEAQGAPIVGTWTKTDDGKYNIVLDSQVSKTTIKDDKLFVKFGDGQLALRKLETINPKKDVKKR